MIIDSDKKQDTTYVPLSSTTPAAAARVTRGTPWKVTFGVVTAYHSDKQHALTGSPFRLPLLQKECSASGSEYVSILGSSQSSGQK